MGRRGKGVLGPLEVPESIRERGASISEEDDWGASGWTWGGAEGGHKGSRLIHGSRKSTDTSSRSSSGLRATSASNSLGSGPWWGRCGQGGGMEDSPRTQQHRFETEGHLTFSSPPDRVGIQQRRSMCQTCDCGIGNWLPGGFVCRAEVSGLAIGFMSVSGRGSRDGGEATTAGCRLDVLF